MSRRITEEAMSSKSRSNSKSISKSQKRGEVGPTTKVSYRSAMESGKVTSFGPSYGTSLLSSHMVPSRHTNNTELRVNAYGEKLNVQLDEYLKLEGKDKAHRDKMNEEIRHRFE